MSKRTSIDFCPHLHRVIGDLITVKADILVQQCNCLTLRASGLAQELSRRLGADFYQERKADLGTSYANVDSRPKPGSVRKIGKVYALFAQWRPGQVRGSAWNRYPESIPKETTAVRLKWFKECLDHLASDLGKDAVSVAFPDHIGCGLAGGDWTKYKQLLEEWAQEHDHITVIIVAQR